MKVVLLRSHGVWRSRNQVLTPPHYVGEFIYEWADRAHWGRSRQARLVNPARPENDLVRRLQFAEIIAAREGGLFVIGREYFHRGVKSKPVERPQVWWCMFDLEPALKALSRMDARTSTGFRVNDDD